MIDLKKPAFEKALWEGSSLATYRLCTDHDGIYFTMYAQLFTTFLCVALQPLGRKAIKTKSIFRCLPLSHYIFLHVLFYQKICGAYFERAGFKLSSGKQTCICLHVCKCWLTNAKFVLENKRTCRPLRVSLPMTAIPPNPDLSTTFSSHNNQGHQGTLCYCFLIGIIAGQFKFTIGLF